MVEVAAVNTPHDVSAVEREELEEHVSEILFDAANEYDPACLFCKRAVEVGIFARYGFHPESDSA